MLKSGITKRWLITTILVIALILTFVSLGVTLLIRDYYYDMVESKLQSMGQSTVLAEYFGSYNSSSAEVFSSRAQEYVENFAEKNIAEVWVINKTGEVIVTSTGFIAENEPIPDHAAALESPSGRAFWTGKLSSGEKVMTLTALLPMSKNSSTGAVRYMISLEKVDAQIGKVGGLVAFIALFALALVFISGMFFVRSIVVPIKKLNEVAKDIAAGDYTQTVEVSNQYDELAELSESINYMTKEIDKTDKLKNDFISTISHELRTPLTAIKGWAETLIYINENGDETFGDGLKVILNETERLYSLVEDLLDFSKIESGRLSLRLKKMDVLAELDDAVYVLRDRAMREGLEITYSTPDYPAPMNGDADRIKQVFVNIIDNAIKYTPAGGRISIVAILSPKQLKIVFADTGCGIAPEDLPKIKEKFYKANVSVKGSGIGLAVCDEIITLHKGTLEVESTLGQGTEVTVVLPLLPMNQTDGKEP